MRNSYGMMANYKTNEELSFEIIGGLIEMKFILSENNDPEECTKLYHNYVNGWLL